MLRNNLFRTILASMLVVCALGFYSCSSDDDGGNEPGNEKNIIGKWEVKNSGAEYGSFEFTGDKKYIIEQHVKGARAETNYIIIIFGDYSAANINGNEYTLNLKDFGTIVINISASGATITVNGETYDTNKAQEVNMDRQTELLCHTWEVKSSDDDGIIATGIMTFTTSGTYFQSVTNNEEPDEIGYDNGTWEWKGSNTLYVSYTSYWDSYSNGEHSSGTEIGYDNWNLIKLTDKEFIFEFDDEGGIVRVTGTR